ncbi:MAG: Xaa-Pro peptidase family protein [Deltaproteobacteria bacterium]|nr:Xaa-Pro peptidase family protein [Deltaproteobacteria bacterium]
MILTQNREILDRRLKALRRRLAEDGAANADTAWILQPENRRYLSGFKASDTQLTESSGSLLITENQAVLITDSRYTTEARMEAPGFEVRTLKRDPVSDLPDILRSIGTKQLGFEGDYLTWGMHRQLGEATKKLSNPIGLEPLPTILEDLREIKDERELHTLRDAADLISDILKEVIKEIRSGTTEKEVARRIESLAMTGGAEALSFPSIVASGPNSALPHAVPTDRKLRVKEPIVIDAGVRLNGYCSDMTRTVFIGEPEPDFKNIYRIVREAQSAAIKAIKPGRSTTEIDGIARSIIETAGYGTYFGHGLGHGLGLATHERPKLGPRKPVPLKKGWWSRWNPGFISQARGNQTGGNGGGHGHRRRDPHLKPGCLRLLVK